MDEISQKLKALEEMVLENMNKLEHAKEALEKIIKQLEQQEECAE